MSTVGQREAITQQRVLRLFRDTLGYDYLGYWKERVGNSNVEESILRSWLTRNGHGDGVITKVLHALDQAKSIGGRKNLYDANREVYGLLRYGVKIRPDVGEQTVNVWLIDWANPRGNEFAIAEEVSIAGQSAKRPDIVLYVNGIAVGVLELKRSVVSIGEGIRQNLDSQKKEFIRPFFATVQLVMAGNDTEGLRYAVIETSEKYYLTWKEPGAEENLLDRALGQLCSKERLLELIHDFVVFDAGVKKIARHNQFFGVKSAHTHVRRREGGIIWHSQGSGKTLTMVWLAKWLRENVTGARVLLITDRTELDEQIEGVFLGVNEQIYRTRSRPNLSGGADLINVLNRTEEWLVASLVHKFGSSDEGDVDSYLAELRAGVSKGFRPKGELFVFVDECHRTQSGKLHDAMEALLPGAMFIGFTGTPLLKKDKQKSIEIFGRYIHTYKYDEAVRDKAVLDLRYEARDIDQSLSSPDKIDLWFEAKTAGLTDVAKAQLKRRWGTMQRVLSSHDRLQKIVADILMDMETKDRLRSGHGNALLVSGSIDNACRLFEMFQKTELAGRCAIVTSYKPTPSNIKGEETGEGQTARLERYDIYRKMLAAHFNESEDTAVSKVEQFETEVKKRFIDEPGQMKLLLVVDKLLTGFDAPPATYLYIDKQMRDHGLFQAICRVNRLDSVDKEYGQIIDYKDLLGSLERSFHDYTGGDDALSGYDAEDVKGLVKDRLTSARERLEELRESVKALCEPVEPPRDTQAYLRFFCGDTAAALKDTEPRRVALYEVVASLLRAYAEIANEMTPAGYSPAETQLAKGEVEHYEKAREEVKLASGDYIDMKMYEPAMRHLIDAYIRAEDSRKLSSFDDMTLVQLFAERGEAAVDALPGGLKSSPEAMAETIENNIRKVIIDETAVNPRYFEKMSQLLDALIKARKQQAIAYADYLAKIVDLAKQTTNPGVGSSYPPSMNSAARQAFYDNLNEDEAMADRVDMAIRDVKKDAWRGNRLKEREIRIAIRGVLGADESLVETIFEIAKSQRGY